MPTEPITPEDGITSPEQEIKDVFKTLADNKAWQAGEPLDEADWETYVQDSLHRASSGDTISLNEARKRIEQLKAFQTHGS